MFSSPRFTLARLFWAVSLAAILLSPLAWHLSLVRHQRQVITQLEQRGVLVGYADWRPQAAFAAHSAAPGRGSPTGGSPKRRGSALGSSTRGGWTAGSSGRNWINSWNVPADFVCAVEYGGSVQELEPILELPDVTTIAYVNAPVDERLVRLLCRVQRLETLNLSDTDLDDAGLLALAEITSLRYLSIMGTKVTPEAVLEFKQQRPNCTISSDLDTKFLLCLQRLMELRAYRSQPN